MIRRGLNKKMAPSFGVPSVTVDSKVWRAAAALGRLYASLRLFVNCFQPSFKLAEKHRDGAQVRKRYHKPATPYQRLLDDPRTSRDVRLRVSSMYATLDPVRLLQDIRTSQQKLVDMADTSVTTESGSISAPTIDQFLASLKTIWRHGQANPTARTKPKVPRSRRRPDPLAAVKQQIEIWFTAEPSRTARELLDRLKVENPSLYHDGHLRTLQRRLKGLRRQAAKHLVLGSHPVEKPAASTVEPDQPDASRSLATAQWEARVAGGLLPRGTPVFSSPELPPAGNNYDEATFGGSGTS